MRRSWILGVSTFVMAAVAAAGPRGELYRIELSNGSQVVSRGVPVTRGSVVTFHEASNGALTGVPAEMVVRIVPDAGARAVVSERRPPRVGSRPAPDITVAAPPANGLQPGEVVVIGPTGGGMSPAPTAAGAAAASGSAAGAGNMGNAVNGYGGGVSPNVVNPNLVLTPNGTLLGPDGLGRVPSTTDLSQAQTPQTVIGPNGTPVTMVPGQPVPGQPVAAQQPVIGPNGTPVMTAAPGQPAAGQQQVIGPNGTPVLAPQGQPGAAPPVIGPNGTPVLAPPGEPGSAPQNTGPNGTPSSPPGGGASASSASPGRS